jgi:hypothetical protein
MQQKLDPEGAMPLPDIMKKLKMEDPSKFRDVMAVLDY